MSAPPIEIPTPAGVQANNGIDLASDLSPTSPVDRKKIEDLIGKRSTPAELKGKGILKGAPNDALAGKKAELQKSMLEDRLEKELAGRSSAADLIKKGILNADPTA